MRQERQHSRAATLALVGSFVIAGMGIGFALIARDDNPNYGLFIKNCVENRSMAAAECDAIYEAPRLIEKGDEHGLTGDGS